MIYKVEKILRDVRVCLDHNAADVGLSNLGDSDTLTLDDIIKSKIVEAVIRVHSAAPSYLLEGGHNFGDAIYWGEQESGHVLLPRDFMRLIAFQMSDWDTAVYSAISGDSAEYALQRQRVKALRGTRQRPVCAIVVRPEGLALEFYSCRDEEATVVRGQYLPYPEIDDDGGVDISERCYPAIVYAIASLVLTTQGEADKAALMEKAAQGLLT